MRRTDGPPVARDARGVVKRIRWPLLADLWRLPLLGPSDFDIKNDLIEVLGGDLLGLVADRNDPKRTDDGSLEASD